MAIESYFENIADAIRERGGTSATLTPAQMPQAILDIPGGGGGGGEIPPLPSTYQEVEYIGFSGTQFISVPSFSATIFDCVFVDFTRSGASTQESCMCGNGNNSPYWEFYIMSNNVRSSGSFTTFSFNVSNGSRYLAVGQMTTNANYSGMWVGAYRPSGSTYPLKDTYIHKLRIYQAATGSYIYAFVPCYRKSDNIPGFYDVINDVFYTNDGTGSFIVGNPV